MKELIGMATLEEAKKMTAEVASERATVAPVHCSMCTNCSGIVGD